MPTLSDIAALLQTSEKNLPARVAGLKLGDACGRCAGSGNYSYNAMHGTRCFGCGGSGQKMPKDLAALALRCETAVTDGRLAAYVEGLHIKRELRGAERRMFDAWGEVFKTFPYDWRDSGPWGTRPNDPVAIFRSQQNKIICDASEALRAILRAYEYPKKGEMPPTPREVKAADEAFHRVVAEVRATVAKHAEAL